MIEVLPNRCQPYLYRRSRCNLCVEVCPEECIGFRDSLVSIDEEVCTSCGLCTTACPSGALRLKGFDDIALFEKIKEIIGDNERVVFLCSTDEDLKGIRLEKGTSLIRLPCIGILKDAHLFGLLVGGVKEVWLRSSCRYCSDESNGRKLIEKMLGYTNRLKELFDIEGEVILSEDFPDVDKGKKAKVEDIVPAPHYSRRELFLAFRDKTERLKKIIEEIDEEEEEIEFLPDEELPERRQLLIRLLKEDVKEPVVQVFNRGDLPFKRLSIDRACTLCEICDLFCPTGALDRKEDDNGVRIVFTAQRCVDCFECETLCPEDAISTSETLSTGIFFKEDGDILSQRAKVPCRVCKKMFLPASGEDTCRTCRKREARDRAFLAIYGIGS